jgi:hypothetical protein
MRFRPASNAFLRRLPANCHHRAAKLDLCRQMPATICSLLLPQPADCREFLTALTGGNLSGFVRNAGLAT